MGKSKILTVSDCVPDFTCQTLVIIMILLSDMSMGCRHTYVQAATIEWDVAQWLWDRC